MTTRDVGDRVSIRHEVRNSDGALTAATVAVAVTKPDGTTLSPAPTVSTPSTGIYDAAFTLDAAGKWRWKWTVSGTVVEVAYGDVDAQDPAPPAYERLSNLKLALGIDSTDATRDALLNKNLLAASRGIDKKCGYPARRFYLDASASARTFTPRGRVVPTTNGDLFVVDDIGSTTGMVVEVGSGATFTAVDGGDYETQPDNAIANGEPITGLLRTAGSWGLAAGTRVRVTARWGWPAIPDEVEEATRIQAARLFKRKDSPEGVMGSAEWGVIRVAKLDPDVVDLISDFIRRPRGFA